MNERGSCEEVDINPIDIVFYILLGLVIFCLMPYYESLMEAFWAAAKAETGREIYYSMFALIMGDYFGHRPLLKKTLNNYDFVRLDIIKNTSCSGSDAFQKQLTNQLISQYGDDGFRIEFTSNTITADATYKEKLKCMPSKTSMAYTLRYKDFYGEEREIIYVDDDSFYDLLRVASYEIIYEKMGEFLNNHQGKRKVSYQFYLLKNKQNLIDMSRNNIIEESALLEYPTKASLSNYSLDKRTVLQINMSDLSKREEAHDLIDKLSDISDYPLNIIINYGKTTEYFIQGQYCEINSLQEYIELLSSKI